MVEQNTEMCDQGVYRNEKGINASIKVTGYQKETMQKKKNSVTLSSPKEKWLPTFSKYKHAQ